MTEIGAFEAKTHFSELLKRVEQGEVFNITIRGKLVAVLASPEAGRKKRAFEAFHRLIDIKKRHPVGTTDEIQSWKNEGRR
jgi:prevent-host-death family protein